MVTIKNRPRQESQFIDVFDEDQVQKAIVYRKAKYDEGAEKVQNQINQLGQLPTITDEDAKIVQDKISNLTSNVNSIAGLDLSNQFNINKISSLSSEIVDNPEVQAAVSSARNLQKNQKFIEEAKMNPKKYGNVIAVQNEDDFYQQLQKHKQDRALGKQSVFSYTYQPYTDVEGILYKKMEKIKADISMGQAGNYFTKDEVITPDKIRNVAYGLIQGEPTLANQIRINSNYATKGVSDEQLLIQKNRIQLHELRNKTDQLNKQIVNLYSVDLTNPKETEKIASQYKNKIKEYESYAKTLQQNPNKLINIETGEVDNNKYDRHQLAYEITQYSIGSGLADMFSKNNRTISANPIPLKQKELDWQINMDNLNYQLALAKNKRQEEELSFIRQAAALEAKTKLKVDDTGNVSWGVPENVSALPESSENLVTALAETKKSEIRETLKSVMIEKFRTIQGVANGGLSQDHLNRFIDSMITPDGKIKDFNDTGTIRRMQAYAKSDSGFTPEAKVLQEGLKFVHKIKKDVDNIWKNDKFIAPENAKLLKTYSDGVHEISSLNASKDYAMQAGLKAAGISKEEYNKLNNLYKDEVNTAKFSSAYAPNQASLTNKRGLTQEEKLKYDAFNKGRSEYYNKRLATAKIYPVVNFNEKADPVAFENVQKDISRFIKQGVGADVTGTMSISSIYGKTDKWSDLKLGSDAEIIPISYAPKSGIQTVKVKYKTDKGEVEEERNFYINPKLMQSYIPQNVNESLKSRTYDDALDLADNGVLQAKVNRKVYDEKTKTYKNVQYIEDVWKTTASDNPEQIPIRWKAQRIVAGSPENRGVYIYLDLPINGNNTPFKWNHPFADAETAETALTKSVDKLTDILKKQGKTPVQIKQEVLTYLLKLNGR